MMLVHTVSYMPLMTKTGGSEHVVCVRSVVLWKQSMQKETGDKITKRLKLEHELSVE